jgi:acid stress-induced BolA-like protein IbaG/YrbA
MSISSEEIEVLVAGEIPNSQVAVQGGESNFQLSVVSDFFEGLSAVKRQQAIYKILNPHIASGAIHAVSMSLKTTAELSS